MPDNIDPGKLIDAIDRHLADWKDVLQGEPEDHALTDYLDDWNAVRPLLEQSPALARLLSDRRLVDDAMQAFTGLLPPSIGARSYRVRWEAEIQADSAEEAAEKARALLREREVFTVTEGRNVATVDLTGVPPCPRDIEPK